MNARLKLNTAYALGSIVVAALVGTLLRSWTAFAVGAALLIALCFVNRTIRPHGRRR